MRAYEACKLECCMAINCSLKCCNTNCTRRDTQGTGTERTRERDGETERDRDRGRQNKRLLGAAWGIALAGLARHVACHKIINTLIELLTDTHEAKSRGSRRGQQQHQQQSSRVERDNRRPTCECGAPPRGQAGCWTAGRGDNKGARGAGPSTLLSWWVCVCFHASLSCRHAMANSSSSSNGRQQSAAGTTGQSHVSASFKASIAKWLKVAAAMTDQVCVCVCACMCVHVCVCVHMCVW